jgi:hypothetical protein
MFSQLRSGRIQAETAVSARQSAAADEQAGDFAARYCAAQHRPGGTSAQRRLMGDAGTCPVCGQPIGPLSPLTGDVERRYEAQKGAR